jgi:hypothetical protein
MSEKKLKTPSVWKRMVSSSSRKTYKDIKKTEKEKLEKQLAKENEEEDRKYREFMRRENARYDRLYGYKNDSFTDYETTQKLRREMAEDFKPRWGGKTTRRSKTRRSKTRRSKTRRSKTRR